MRPTVLYVAFICAAGCPHILRNVPGNEGDTLEALEEQLAQHPSYGRSGDEAGTNALMAGGGFWKTRICGCASSLGSKVQSLYSRHYQAPVLLKTPPAACFPMLPLRQSRRREPLYFFRDVGWFCLATTDAHFFSPRRRLAAGWDMIARGGDYCVLQLRRQHACGFDYLAQIRYQLLRNQLVALTLTHCGSTPIPLWLRFSSVFLLISAVRCVCSRRLLAGRAASSSPVARPVARLRRFQPRAVR